MTDEDITVLALKYHYVRAFGCKVFLDGSKIVIALDEDNDPITEAEYQKIAYLQIMEKHEFSTDNKLVKIE